MGRVALLGDACHPMTPYMAQGAATSIEDAAVLARCLEAVDGEDIEGAFRRYEAHRKPRTSRIQAISSANTWMRTAAKTTTGLALRLRRLERLAGSPLQHRARPGERPRREGGAVTSSAASFTAPEAFRSLYTLHAVARPAASRPRVALIHSLALDQSIGRRGAAMTQHAEC